MSQPKEINPSEAGTNSSKYVADDSERRRQIQARRSHRGVLVSCCLIKFNDLQEEEENIFLCFFLICRNAHQPCEYSQNFPLGVESKCKQQFVYRNLLAINQEGKPVMEHFQFPSCCKCMVTSNRSYSRFGENSDNERKDRLILA